jgi:hypothetical protein
MAIREWLAKRKTIILKEPLIKKLEGGSQEEYRVVTVYPPRRYYHYDLPEDAAKKALELHREGIRAEVYEWRELAGIPTWNLIGDSGGSLDSRWRYVAFIVNTLEVNPVEDDWRSTEHLIAGNPRIPLDVRRKLSCKFPEIREKHPGFCKV